MQENDFYTRSATNQDVAATKELIYFVLKEYGLSPDESTIDNDLNDIEKYYQNNGGYFGLIYEAINDTLIGTYGLFQTSPGICEIRKMYLLKEYRGKGIGKKVLSELISKAKEMNYKRIELETATVLKEAIGLYIKFGFQEFDNCHTCSRCDKAFFLDLE